MKIIYCISGTFNSGGMERVLANKANYLVGLGHEIIVITTDQQRRSPYFPLDTRIRNIDLDVNYCENNNKALLRKALNYYKKQKNHRQKLKRILYELRGDIVISMFDHDVSFLYKINDGSKKVLEIHFSRFKRLQYGRRGLWKIVDKLRSINDLSLAKKYDQFVVLTEEDRSYWGDLPNIQVIFNANTFSPSAVAKLESKQVVAIGRYDYQKGFDDLIKSWKLIHNTHPDWMLKIYGHGPLENEFKKLIDDLNLHESVSLCAPSREIEQVYMDSSILVMTSRYEGFGMVLIEAQSCGVPVVAYACKCGPRDIIFSGHNGFLINEGDEGMFVEKVNLLIEKEDLRKEIGKKAKVMSIRFSEDVVMKKWEDLFSKLVNEKSKG
jgi:glycosyltransferase involved in cell wall biosynthesis